jgi:hypothetical protein
MINKSKLMLIGTVTALVAGGSSLAMAQTVFRPVVIRRLWAERAAIPQCPVRLTFPKGDQATQ